MDPPSVMTIDELADYLQVAKSTLYKLAQEGKVPGQKVGKHWRFRRASIDQWLAEGSASPGAAAESQTDTTPRNSAVEDPRDHRP